MSGLTLVAVGTLPGGILAELAAFLAEAAGVPVSVEAGTIDPAFAYDRHRGQMDCRKLLPILEDLAAGRKRRVLGVADVDLFSAMFTFVLGEAKLGGQAGLISLHRLRPALYGLPEDADLLVSRAHREALHETGHLLGLVHCRAASCVMRFSGTAEEVDLKNEAFCPACHDTLSALTREASRPPR